MNKLNKKKLRPNRLKDISGRRDGPCLAIERRSSDKNGRAIWLFKCDCGRVFEQLAYTIINRNRKYCSKNCGFIYKPSQEEQKLKAKEYRKLHKDKMKLYFIEYKKKNKLVLKERAKEYRNKTKIKRRERYKNNINLRLGELLRNRIKCALKCQRQNKSGSAVRDLGCSIEKFKLWIEMNWKDGMNWDNHSFNGWHLDHIRPLSSFNLSNRDEWKQACHYTNIQPLWQYENLSKSDNYDYNTRY